VGGQVLGPGAHGVLWGRGPGRRACPPAGAPRTAASTSAGDAPAVRSARRASCSATEAWARPGRVAEGRPAQAREPPPAPVDEVLELRVRAGSDRVRWNASLSRVNRTGSKSARHCRSRSLIARASARSAAARCGWASATAAPSTIARVWQASSVVDRVDRGHPGADVALERHHALGLQPPDRLPHRHHAHPQLAGELVEHQPVPGP
jgi:hypothetical protein